MGRKHAKIISRDAFMQSFVEAEVIMRRNLAARIQVTIDTYKSKITDEPDEQDAYIQGIVDGLQIAREEIFGKVETNDVG